MRAFLLVAAAFAAVFYYTRVHREKPEPAPPPAAAAWTPAPVLSPEEVEKIRALTRDADAQVRWAAIELLHRMQDPSARKLLEKTLASDLEASVRERALGLLKSSAKPGVSKEIVPALGDTEKNIRMAALIALGEIGDPDAAPYVTRALRDSEPDVRLQALRTLGRLQEKRVMEYRPLQEQLKRDHERLLSQPKP